MGRKKGVGRRARAAAGFLALLLLSGCAPAEPGLAAPGQTPPPAAEAPVREDTRALAERPAEAPPELLEESARETPAEALTPEPADTDFVRVRDYIPGIAVELRYATEDNFCGQAVYDFSEAHLRYGTVKKLSAAQEALAARGYGLKIWDAYRPAAAQFTLWEICPDSRYVADPNRGYSSHSKGNTVDVTWVTAGGADVERPTGFDDFSALADRDYSDVPEAAAVNALLLEETMAEAGFSPYFGEWWHFSDTHEYEVAETLPPEMEEDGDG